MNEDAGTTIINERHDYTGAALAICLALVAIGYFLTHRGKPEPPQPSAAQIYSPSVASAAYEVERTRLLELQNEILKLRQRCVQLDPRMESLRSELTREIRVKFALYKAEYEGSYIPMKRAAELSQDRGQNEQ